ncbi:MAG TPA: hypothetical protein VLD37_04235 [Candidatus Bilamarchaeum sp.]|nr:hypothetical protein [Candidatus Bilamarchaeum sp.]
MANPRDLSRLMELAKKKAELEFGRAVLGQDTDFELKQVARAHSELAVKTAGVEIVLPQGNALAELQKTVSGFSADDLREALKIRDGKVYHFLTERGRIVKRNFENRMEIAKIALIRSKLGAEEKEMVADALRRGSIGGSIRLRSLDEKACRALARLMTRCGISARAEGNEIRSSDAEIGEVRMEVSNRSIWIDKSMKFRLEENVKKIHQVNSAIQLKNAERQIKVFNSDEETQFSSLQRQYLDLLKEQDEMLREYNEEEKL